MTLQLSRTSGAKIDDKYNPGVDRAPQSQWGHDYEREISEEELKESLLDYIFMLIKEFNAEVIVCKNGDIVYLEIYDDYRE